jgi:hypothetical protein
MFVDVEVVDADHVKLKKRTNDANNGTYVDTSALSADYDGSGFALVTGSFYMLKESVDIKNVTAGNTLSTDHWGATGITTQFDAIDISDFLINKYSSDRYGSSTNDVYGMSADRTSNIYKLTSCGLPKNRNSISSAGTNQMGNDDLYKFIRNEVCAVVFGDWASASNAGVRYVILDGSRTYSYRSVSARSCLNAKDV